jgi:hypothetical protein
MSGSVAGLKQRLFGSANYVCGGHGARWPSDTQFTVPSGITINFYVPDGSSLDNAVGQQVDHILTGGVGPTPTEVIKSGALCWNYRLFSPRAGGYLPLGMSSGANQHYISTADSTNGEHLEAIVKWVIGSSPNATIHWSACRAIEPENMAVAWSDVSETYDPGSSKGAALARLASKVGKNKYG